MSTSRRFAVAIHILTVMAAAEAEEAVTSERIAASVNTNPVVVRRILCALAHTRLVTSQTGPGGGSRLARGADRITLLEIYRATEERELFARHTNAPSARCPVGSVIGGVLADVLGKVDAAVERALAGVTIADVLAATHERRARCHRKRR